MYNFAESSSIIKYTIKDTKKARLKSDQQEAVNNIKEYSNRLKEQLEKIWEHYDTKTKFVEVGFHILIG